MEPDRPPYPTKQFNWRLNARRISAWRKWDGEAVVYDDLSGDTLKLDVIMAEVFARLHQGGATSGELAQHLAKALDVEVDLRLERLVEIAIERFADSGLISTDGPPVLPAGESLS